MRRKVSKLSSLLVVACLLSACGTVPEETAFTLNEKDFETDKRFITFADIPPSPYREEDLQLYLDLDFTKYVLTEDFSNMIENGKLSDDYKNAITKLSEAGSEVWIRNMYNDPDYFELDKPKVGSNYGTPYELVARKLTDEFNAFDKVTGFYMADEFYMKTLKDNPSTEYDESLFSAMDQFGKIVDWKNRYYPNHYFHVNHVPSSSYDHYEGGYTYKDFIQYYVDNIVKKLPTGGRSICLDNYPLKETGGTIEESYLIDLLIVANITRDYNATASAEMKADYGICLQTFQNTHPYAKLRDITSAEDITFQMYSGMAMGASLFEYFCYRSYENLGMFGIVDDSGQKRIYDTVLEANKRAIHFEKVLLSFDWKGLSVSKGESNQENEDIFANATEFLTKETGSLKNTSSRYDAIIGSFKKDNQNGYMVVNYVAPDSAKTNIVNLNFENCTQALVYTESGVEKVNLVGSGELRLTLQAGEGVFVIPA